MLKTARKLSMMLFYVKMIPYLIVMLFNGLEIEGGVGPTLEREECKTQAIGWK